MNRHPPEPLTQEERELAQLIARVGPLGGEPATALDAKILAAAHAAVGGKPRRGQKPRWPVAMGLAASVVLAVGVAWQLRPLQQAPIAASDAPLPAVAETSSQAAAEPAADVASPLPVDTATQDPAATAGPAPAAPLPPPAMAKQVPPRAVPVPPSRRPARTPPPEAPPVRQRALDGGRPLSGTAPAAPPPPPAPTAAMAAPAPAMDAPSAFTPEPREAAVAEGPSANEDASYFAARTAAAAKQTTARGEMKAAAALREQERGAQQSHEQDHTTLDRVEVSGSRLQRTDRQVPISDDARLPVDEWLERVRTRYGLGDAEAAKRSLLLFVRDHPEEAIPGDLEPLLEK
jgi:hypothetical protein